MSEALLMGLYGLWLNKLFLYVSSIYWKESGFQPLFTALKFPTADQNRISSQTALTLLCPTLQWQGDHKTILWTHV